VGVTLNLVAPLRNIFLTGHAGDGTVTGRVFTEDVAAAPTSRLFVQSFRPPTGSVRSIVEVDGLDVLRMFEAYYERSEQFPARFLRLGEQRFGLLQALPDGGREALARLRDADVAGLFGGPRDLLVEQTFRFRCGCNPAKIVSALREIFAGRTAELFRDDPGVEAFCPRCGARWWIERAAFDAGGAGAP
jgi:redox-regulated HSP33 family molecular chaperone